METKRETYARPEITIVEFRTEKGYSVSTGAPSEIFVGDQESLWTFEEDGAKHYVAGQVNRSRGEDKGWF